MKSHKAVKVLGKIQVKGVDEAEWHSLTDELNFYASRYPSQFETRVVPVLDELATRDEPEQEANKDIYYED